MLITLFFAAIFFVLLRQQNSRRGVLVVAALASYVLVILVEQLYLETNFGRHFHASDPSNYFDHVYRLTWDGLLRFFESGMHRSNTFYYVVNWVFLNNYFDPTVTAIFLKVTNALVFLSAYMLLVGRKCDVDYIDYVLLFHPFVYFTLIRNVRDFYILFFLVGFVVAWGSRHRYRLNYGVAAVFILMMQTIRPFFVAPMLMLVAADWVSRLRRKYVVSVMVLLAIGSLLALGANAFDVQKKLYGAFFSALVYHGETDESSQEAMREVISGGGSGLGILVSYVGRVAQGFLVFLFTPHPVNYAELAFANSYHGMWKIYTTFDNVLVTLGSAFNYLIAFPLLIRFFHRIRHVSRYHAIIAVYILLIYSVFQLGITDPRIKYTFLFFVLAALKLSGEHLLSFRRDKKYFLIAVLVFFALMLGSG